MRIKSRIFVLFLTLIIFLQFTSSPVLAAMQEESVAYDQSLISLKGLEVKDTTVEIYWVSKDTNIKAAEYDIYRNNSIISTTDSFVYTDVNLVPETNYTYQVKAKDISGNIIAESNILDITTTQSISVMQLTLSISDITDTGVRLDWALSSNQQETSVDGAQSIQEPVEYKVFHNGTCISTTGSSIMINDLAPETEYSFQVTGTVSSDKDSYISNSVKIKTLSRQTITTGDSEYVTDRFIIKYKNGNGKEKLEGAFKDKLPKGKKMHRRDKERSTILHLDKKMKLKDFTRELKDKKMDMDIEYIQPDYEFSLTSEDPNYSNQWGLENKQSGTTDATSIPIEYRLEMLPPHLKDMIEDNNEFKEFLLNASIEELQEKSMTGDIPRGLRPEILMEIMHDPIFRDMNHRAEFVNEPTYLCDAGVAGAWEKATGTGAIVGVMDTGIDITHEDLAENIWVNTGETPDNNIDDDGNGYIDDVHGWNFTEDSNQVYNNSYMSDENHGTHIAGTIAAQKDNGKGIAGVAPSAKILPLKVFQGGKAYTSDIIDAINYAESCGVKIVNCSWGSTNGNPALQEAIQNSGMLFVCAAGNNNGNIDTSPIYPASFDCPNIITTASVNQSGSLSGFSNFGENSVDVAAPGENIESTLPGNTYGQLSGTSMAAAFLSGEAALLLSEAGGMSITDLKERIMSTGDRLSSLTGKVNGSIKINCTNAINNIVSGEMIQVSDNGQTQGGISAGESMNGYNLFTDSAFQGQVTKIACGNYHSIALRTDGTVWTCGRNGNGQLGDGTTDNKITPVQVIGLNRVVAIAGGGYHSIALKSDGTVWAWGDNYYGELGDGTKADRTTPVQVGGLSGIIAIAGGGYHSIALKNDGTVWTWGNNYIGQLGDGTTVNKTTPVQVSGLNEVTAIAAGCDHSIALKNDGTVWAWGRNYEGQLGDGTRSDKAMPVQVSGLGGVIAIYGGGRYHSIALKSDGTVWAWGDNYDGQLGDGTRSDKAMPVQVSGLRGVIAIDGGAYHSIALKNDGTVWAWGYNYYGQLGDGTINNKYMPVQVNGLSGVIAIAGGDYHSIALKIDGTVWGCGCITEGQLGNGIRTFRTAPLQVSGLNGVIAIAGGGCHSIALKNDGNVWAWGKNDYGQLGDGTEIDKKTPVQVGDISGVRAIAVGAHHSIALKNDGTVWTWGYNGYGELGDGTKIGKTTPVQVNGLSGVTAIAGGEYYSMALKNDGTVWAWGYNDSGQLGDGTKIEKSTPVQVSGLSGVIAIAGGDRRHSIALKKDGTVWAWGYNYSGQLGDGTTIGKTTPVQVIGLNGVIAIEGGVNHSIALKNDGTVWAWGYNYYGQLGDGTTIGKTTPVQVIGLSGVTAIAGGYCNSIALKNDGTVWAWGYNSYGQLGDGTTISRYSPVCVNDLSGITAITAGKYHNIALKNNGTAYAWGDFEYGQLGNGEAGYNAIPRYSFGTRLLNYSHACTINKKFNFIIKANNITSFSGRTYTVIYNTSEVEIVDLCSMTHKNEVDTGIIQGTDITIIEKAPGMIKFTINKPIAPGKTWSGVVNVITFMPCTSGTTTVQCLVQ